MAKNNGTQGKKQTNKETPNTNGNTWMIRSEVATALRCSVSKVRQMEGRKLHGQQMDDGTWIFDPEEVTALQMEMQEAPTGADVLQILADHNAQLMKHLQETMDRANAGQKAVLDMLEKTVSNLSARNDSLTSERLATLGTVEELLSEKTNRDLEHRRQEQNAELRKEAAAKIFALFPLVAKKLAGGDDIHGTANAEMIKNLRDSITEKQLVALSEVLTADQLAVMAELLGAGQT